MPLVCGIDADPSPIDHSDIFERILTDLGLWYYARMFLNVELWTSANSYLKGLFLTRSQQEEGSRQKALL